MKNLSKIGSFLKYSIPTFWNHPLSRNNRFRPILRFILLQIQFSYKKVVIVNWIKPIILPLRRGDTGLTGNYYLGLDEFVDMMFLIHFLRPDDLFLDIGSNLGSFSLLASGICKSKSIAYEPCYETYKRLLYVINFNNLHSLISVKNVALGSPSMVSASNTISFSIDRGSTNSIVDQNYTGSSVSVPLRTLDEDLNESIPSLIKIDVEGFELDVIQGSRKLLASENLLAIILEGSNTDVIKTLKSYGFYQYYYDPFGRQLLNHCHMKSTNSLFLRPSQISSIMSRITHSPKRLILNYYI